MDIHIGNKRRGDKGEYVGRPHPLGNPFVIGRDGDRATVIAKYREWLEELWARYYQGEMSEHDIAAMGELWRLTGLAQRGSLTLICWCAPLPCHAEVIREQLLNFADGIINGPGLTQVGPVDPLYGDRSAEQPYRRETGRYKS